METTVELVEHSQIAEVRRVVGKLGKAHGMSETDVGRALLVGTEAATNSVKYARKGSLAVSWFDEGGASGIQMVAADHGPGFVDYQNSSRDGHSTGGSLGLGIGIMARNTDEFDLYTAPGQGSVFLLRVSCKGLKPKRKPAALSVGSRSVPMAGQATSGDAWASKVTGRRSWVCAIDGLGHGPLAGIAAAEAVRVFNRCAEGDTPVDVLRSAHDAMRATRGAVMAVLSIDAMAGTASFAGIGNIAGVILGPGKPQHLVSVEGVVGYNLRTTRQYEHSWTAGSTLVLNSDGLSTRWSLSKLPGLVQRHPSLIAAALHRDFGKDTDDCTVVVARTNP